MLKTIFDVIGNLHLRPVIFILLKHASERCKGLSNADIFETLLFDTPNMYSLFTL